MGSLCGCIKTCLNIFNNNNQCLHFLMNSPRTNENAYMRGCKTAHEFSVEYQQTKETRIIWLS